MILINVSNAFPAEAPQADERSKKIDAVLKPQPQPKKIIKKFVINGDTLITPKDFDTVLSKYRDKELSGADLQKAADEITGLYRRKGYIVNLSYVAEQGDSDNTVEFKVVPSGIKEAPADKPKEEKPEPKTLVKKFVINGDTLFTPKDFEVVLSKYRDKELDISDLKKAMDEITGLYRRKGYILTLVYMPEQEIIDNTVEFKVAPTGIKEAPADKLKEEKPEPKTLVKKFVINGDTLFTPKDFEVVLSKYRNKELGISDLKRAVGEITGLYRRKGYILTLVYIPEQEMTDNTVEFKVIESRVGEIQVEKPKYSRLDTEKNKILLERGQILDYKKLEANLRRINKQPDKDMRAVLSPGATAETTNILFKMDKEKSPQHFYTEFNNLGTKNTSKNRWGLGYVNNNLSGNDDSVSLRFIANDRADVYSVSAAYDFPVSQNNTRLGAYAAYSRADIGGQFAILSPEGDAKVWGLYLNHPWLDKEFYDDSADTNFTLTSNLTAGFDSISVYNKILGAETSHDELRVFKAGINFEETDSFGRSGLAAEINAGVPDILGAMSKHDPSASRVDSGGEFQKYIGSLTRVTRLPLSFLLINSFKYQLSPFALVNSEQMLLGGADTVRGYPENEYLADYGWVNTVELRAPVFFLPHSLKVPFDKKRISLADAIQLVGFFDAGKGYLNNARVGEAKQKYLVSIGFGFRFDFYEHLRGRLDIGFPVGGAEPSDNSNGKLHFGLQYEW
jgi:hemolysin activation/secretion protein